MQSRKRCVVYNKERDGSIRLLCHSLKNNALEFVSYKNGGSFWISNYSSFEQALSRFCLSSIFRKYVATFDIAEVTESLLFDTEMCEVGDYDSVEEGFALFYDNMILCGRSIGAGGRTYFSDFESAMTEFCLYSNFNIAVKNTINPAIEDNLIKHGYVLGTSDRDSIRVEKVSRVLDLTEVFCH